MPRLLPRLLKALQENPGSSTVARVRPRKRTSLYRPVPLSPPSFHPAGRTRSILLDENPITDKRVFARHKRRPPRAFLGRQPPARDAHDPPREMTAQEREWWSSPYLRMLATPLRWCAVSRRHLPNDFLVRLAVFGLPPTTHNSRSVEVLMPDGLEHPKYKRKRARVAIYVPCWKDAVGTMKSPVSLPRREANVVFSQHLRSHIGCLLRLRVLQELEVLIDALKQHRGRIEFDLNANPTVLRRLTRSEFRTLRDTGIIPYPDAAAVLVVPPVNRDPKTKLRPRPSREPEIPSSQPTALPEPVYKKSLPPLSNLHRVKVLEPGVSTLVPSACVPLYNGLAMFPSPQHRAALYKLVTELLDVERQFRGARTTGTRDTNLGRAKGDAKGSHAFLLVSNAQTVGRADTAALAIALWRLRMWEGDAFTDHADGWEIGKDWRFEQIHRI